MGSQICLCVPLFAGEKGEHKQNFRISQKMTGQSRDSPGIIPGQCCEILVYAFSCLLFFPALDTAATNGKPKATDCSERVLRDNFPVAGVCALGPSP